MTSDATMMEYLNGLRTFYDGEVYGERVLLALHAAARTPREAYHFATILQLETETKARLRPLLLRHGLSIAETADPGAVAARLASYSDQSWSDYAAATAARLRHVLAGYEAIAALGPAEDGEVLDAVVAHEAALVSWAEIEAKGPSEASLAAIISMLNFPIAPPG